MAVPLLWLPDKVGKDEVASVKVPGWENPSDLMTKHLAGPNLKRCLGRLRFHYESGRSSVIDGGRTCDINPGDLLALGVRVEAECRRTPQHSSRCHRVRSV